MPHGGIAYRTRPCVDQIQRVERWYQRFVEIDAGTQTNASFDGQEDDVLAFFMNCFHLKDWIKNDVNDPAFAQIVENYINANDCLKLCADICNGAKHFVLTSPRMVNDPSMKTEVHLDVGLENPPVRRKFFIPLETGTEVNAFDIATQCMQKWHQFFRDHEDVLNPNYRR